MKFKVGDRVAVYGFNNTLGRVVDGKRGVIDLIRSDGHVDVVAPWTAGTGYASFHPKQCRRLVKKHRRRIWVPNADVVMSPCLREKVVGETCKELNVYLEIPAPGSSSFTEFVEARRK